MLRYLPRLVDTRLTEFLAELPAVMIVGPRACGKTTTAARRANTVVRLDSEGDAAAFRHDPDAALRSRAEPVLLDEWQTLPSVMGAVKRAVDSERRPGRFIITGSARNDTGEAAWPATGRVVDLEMCPLTVAEQRGRPTVPLIDRLAAGEPLPQITGPRLDLRDYLRLALRSGFPEPALELGETAVGAWLESYADRVALRDARAYGEIPDAGRLRRFLEAYALNSAGCPNDNTLYEAAGISRRTGAAYEQRLCELRVVDPVPAWSTNRLKRLSRRPKRYVADAGLLAGILRVGAEDVQASGTLLGSLIDTFVVAQLRAEASVAATRYRLYHLREQNGRREVDVIAEFGGGRIVGIEIKAAAAVGRSDARHLLWLSEQMGDRFAGGVVLHTGRDTFELADRITAAPIATLWA